jgi:hypothetical protein
LVSSFSEKCFKLSDVSIQKWNLLLFSDNVIHLIVIALLFIFILMKG